MQRSDHENTNSTIKRIGGSSVAKHGQQISRSKEYTFSSRSLYLDDNRCAIHQILVTSEQNLRVKHVHFH
uniref:Uncharacterized protein n=1 Tax=Setaria italica TaxID=4555 RepID=K3YBF9_SETIT